MDGFISLNILSNFKLIIFLVELDFYVTTKNIHT